LLQMNVGVSVVKCCRLNFTRHTIAIAAIMGFLTIMPAAASTIDGPNLLISDGTIEGLYTHYVAEFLGIPYAAPPVSDLHWRPPQPAAKWTESLLTVNFGNTCVQNQAGIRSFEPHGGLSLSERFHTEGLRQKGRAIIGGRGWEPRAGLSGQMHDIGDFVYLRTSKREMRII
jgi:Carboxylesterase family